jgi:thiol-disulfide isomerase/thioredoxin
MTHFGALQRYEGEMTEPPAPEPKNSAALGVLRMLLFAAALGLLAVSVFGGRAPLEAGQPAPELHLQSYDGRGWTLDHFATKPMVVNFWATWCPPCMSELPDFARVARAHPEVVFVGAAVQSPPREVADVVKRLDIPYYIAAVGDEGVRDWNASGLPSTFVLNERHEIVYATGGAMTREHLEEVLVEHLGVTPKAP